MDMKLKIIKKCNCCSMVHDKLPQKYRVWVDDEMLLGGSEPYILGYHFDCQCGSSMFVKATMVIQEIA